MNNRGRRRDGIGIVVLLVGGGSIWFREQRNDALNRKLIAALHQYDNKRALALVRAGIITRLAEPISHPGEKR